jgi:hypothetical protein
MSSAMSAGYELSPQQKLFFANAREKLTAGIAILIEGSISPGKIRDIVQTLIARHEILRTTFQRRTGMKFPFQVVNEKVDLVWEEIDLSAVSTDEENSRVSSVLADSSWLNIEKGPVVRGQLVKLGSNRNVLALAFSALCMDDASLNLLLEEFTSLYAGEELVE